MCDDASMAFNKRLKSLQADERMESEREKRIKKHIETFAFSSAALKRYAIQRWQNHISIQWIVSDAS